MVLEYARSETRYGGERVSAERNQVSRDRGFSGKQFTSLWCTQPFQSFTLAGESDKRIGKQTFRQYRSAARSSPLFLPMEPAQPLPRYIAEEILKRPGRIYDTPNNFRFL